MQNNQSEQHLAHFKSAMEALRGGDYKTATTYLTLSIASCPTVAANIELAKIHFAENNIDKALNCVMKAQDLCRGQRDDALQEIANKVEREFIATRLEREQAIAARDLEISCIDVNWERFNTAASAEAKHECITHLGGAGWRLTVGEVIDRIEKNENRFYVRVAKHSFVRVVNGPNGKYLRAVLTDLGNDMYCDNLFALGSCTLDN